MPTTRKPRAAKNASTSVVKKPSIPEVPSIEIPVIRGIQAGREYYVTQVPLGILKRFTVPDLSELPAMRRSQRVLSVARGNKILDYIRKNLRTYILSALTMSIAADIDFTELLPDEPFGKLRLPLDAIFHPIDGQHRHYALLKAVAEIRDLEDETIPVVFFLDIGEKWRAQAFLDLNQYTSKPSKSIVNAYDHRDPLADHLRRLLKQNKFYERFTSIDVATVSPKSVFLFSFAGLTEATGHLLNGLPNEGHTRIAAEFWEFLIEKFPEWKQVYEDQLTPTELKTEKIQTQAIALCALAQCANVTIRSHGSDWKTYFTLERVNWERANPDFEGLFMFSGNIRKTKETIVDFARYLHKTMEIPL